MRYFSFPIAATLTTLSCCIIYFVIIPSVTVQGNYFVYGNVSWLLTAAQRFLDGQSMAEHYYEPNPPLSILLYTPHIFFSKITNIPLYQSIYWVTSLIIILSVILTALILRSFSFLNAHEKILICAAMLAVCTIGTGTDFSERDHFIGVWLIPFILCQFALTEKIIIPKSLLITTLIVGSIFILIKPHFGILPTALLFVRMVQHKKFLKIILDIDFLILSAITLIYLIVISLFFHDYALNIFPDVLALYLKTSKDISSVLKPATDYIIAYILLIIMELFLEDIKGSKKKLVLTVYICGALALIPYFVQMKGFSYHLIPTYTLMIIGVSLSIMYRLEKHIKLPPSFSGIRALAAFLCIIAIISYYTPLSHKMLTHKDINNLPITQYMEEHCPAPCTYFAFHSSIELFNPTNIYMGYEHATRFPSYWFVPEIFKHIDSDDKNARTNAIKLQKKYAAYVAEDMDYYKPSILLIIKDVLSYNDNNFDYINFFSINPEFKHIIDTRYQKTGTIEISEAPYYKGFNIEGKTHNYDVYERIPTPQTEP